mmetsp:Transcript_26642/g.74540  ORF Transcript_26642/g.74540 Transcript_26642/m.74540 type:complete len:225 (+) Transcript_26642:453-1127(+)
MTAVLSTSAETRDAELLSFGSSTHSSDANALDARFMFGDGFHVFIFLAGRELAHASGTASVVMVATAAPTWCVGGTPPAMASAALEAATAMLAALRFFFGLPLTMRTIWHEEPLDMPHALASVLEYPSSVVLAGGSNIELGTAAGLASSVPSTSVVTSAAFTVLDLGGEGTSCACHPRAGSSGIGISSPSSFSSPSLVLTWDWGNDAAPGGSHPSRGASVAWVL